MPWNRAVLLVALAIVPRTATADGISPPTVPAALEVRARHRPYLLGHAMGTQNYICLPAGAGVAWVLFGPQETLFDDDGDQVITHFLSPNPAESGLPPRATWQHSRDTSRAWAVAIASSGDPDVVAPGAIPWLLLQVVGVQLGPASGDRLTKSTYIQRVNTARAASRPTRDAARPAMSAGERWYRMQQTTSSTPSAGSHRTTVRAHSRGQCGSGLRSFDGRRQEGPTSMSKLRVRVLLRDRRAEPGVRVTVHAPC